MNRLPFLLLFFLLFSYSACQHDEVSGIQSSLDLAISPDTLEIFAPGLVSTNLQERDMAISEDGSELIFSIGNYDQSIRALVGLKKENGKWTDPEILTISGQHNDIEPFFAPGGQRLFFASDRPLTEGGEGKDYNIWVTEKKEGGWSAPQSVGSSINTDGNEFYPAVSQNGNLYFTATYESGVGREDIFISRFENGDYLSPVPLDTMVNSVNYEFNAYISPDEQLIVFSSYGRADGLGGGDLYYSQKDASGNWQKAVHFAAPINSPKLDYCPFIDYPRNNFYFTSNRGAVRPPTFSSLTELKAFSNRIDNGMGNIYRISLTKLPLE